MKTNLPCSLIITRICDQGRGIRSFDLAPEIAARGHGVQFIPGQVAILQVANEEPAYFAFASAPEDQELETRVKRTTGPSLALFALKEGKRVELIDLDG